MAKKAFKRRDVPMPRRRPDRSPGRPCPEMVFPVVDAVPGKPGVGSAPWPNGVAMPANRREAAANSQLAAPKPVLREVVASPICLMTTEHSNIGAATDAR